MYADRRFVPAMAQDAFEETKHARGEGGKFASVAKYHDKMSAHHEATMKNLADAGLGAGHQIYERHGRAAFAHKDASEVNKKAAGGDLDAQGYASYIHHHANKYSDAVKSPTKKMLK